MEEDEDEQDTSIKGRLLMLVCKIKGQSQKAEEPTEKEQAAPCEHICFFITLSQLSLTPSVPLSLNMGEKLFYELAPKITCI